MNPLISVIIPVYNGANFLPEAIATIEEQAYEPLEIIVIDDGSTDDLATVVASYGDRLRYVYQDNQGPAAARNHGITLAQGEFIAFLDVDDQWPANKLQNQLAVLTDQPELAVVNGYMQLMQARIGPDHNLTFVDILAPGLSINLGSALFRAAVFDTVGLFDPEQIHSEDVDWFMRARERQVPMVVLEAVTLKYRLHDHNMIRDHQHNLQGFMRAIRKSIQRRRQQDGEGQDLADLRYVASKR
jgi:glycosyltransferase involved in cell wall biosynthesis